MKKHYLHASKLLVSAINISEGSLKNVEALWEVRNDLTSRKETLYSKLLDDLSRHIYYQSTQELLALRRQGSGRDAFSSTFHQNNLSRSNEKNMSKTKRNFIEAMSNVESSSEEIVEDLNVIDPELNSSHFIAIIIESLAFLNRLPETIEVCLYFFMSYI